MPHPEALSTDEQSAVAEAERRGHPFLQLRNDDGELQFVYLNARRSTYTIGRRDEADIALPWDREVSRLHAELKRLAGEWTISDDGLSQNGTYVNEVRLVGRRRLNDADLVRVGRTSLTFRNPAAGAGGLTLLPGELSAATALSEQQYLVLTELCRPLARDGEGVNAASDEAIAEALGLPLEVIATEIIGLLGAFGVDDLPPEEARADVAAAALGSGLVSFEDLSGA
jgi:pSer/pThr/pTyr-binding forkhead associated (FHA) protein